jgi:hypothetical protein
MQCRTSPWQNSFRRLLRELYPNENKEAVKSSPWDIKKRSRRDRHLRCQAVFLQEKKLLRHIHGSSAFRNTFVPRNDGSPNMKSAYALAPKLAHAERRFQLWCAGHGPAVPRRAHSSGRVAGDDGGAMRNEKQRERTCWSVQMQGGRIAGNVRRARLCWAFRNIPRMEAAGIEPASRSTSEKASTCIVDGLSSARRSLIDRLPSGPAPLFSHRFKAEQLEPASLLVTVAPPSRRWRFDGQSF